MTRVAVHCPYCGRWLVVEVPRERPKGAGAHYAHRIRRLSPLHVEILRVLRELGPMPKRRIQGALFDRGVRVSGNSLSGRLSELAGMGYVECRTERVRLLDRESMRFRFRRTPVWYLTERGRRYVDEALRG